MIYPKYLTSIGEETLQPLNLILTQIIDYLNTWAFGSGIKHDIEIQDTGPADTGFVVQHNLGYKPTGWILYYQNKPGSLYVVSWDNKQATFKFSNSNAHIKFRLF